MKAHQQQLIDKYKSGQLSDSEHRELLSLFHCDDLEFELKQELYDQLAQLPDEANPEIVIPEFDRIWKKIKQKKKAERKTSEHRINYWYYAAAVLIVGLLIGNIFLLSRNKSPRNEFYSAIAPIGSVSQVILPDSTIVFLNSGSAVKYTRNEDQNTREVYLSGEAWFKVKKSKQVPFFVHTPFYNVRVTGTEFNVKAYDEDRDVVTTLEEGEIRVQSSEVLKLKNEIKLKPGEQLVYNKDEKSIVVSDVKTQIYSSWKDNKLIFVNATLKELAVLLERKYGVEIKIEDKQIAGYHYDGTIKNETILDVLNILQNTLPITYQIKGQEIIIRKK
ncbi:FecR family protein [Mangrovibacterium diazotrophicum]|uniref:FecR family protein n=1 Tax=Mangrovibacterium diazotrophicum TaxID=1261403 RepID=A0A419VX69_9BACT|nr:FecR domain-containing protein [Mangrovibacterium diazotrophicum]RKD87825.1 FecR family protein [Mangrovibacterium diazotrophicum]